MDKDKLYETIKKLKKEQAIKYYKCMHTLIAKDIPYYKDKKYARYFLKYDFRDTSKE